MLLHVIFKKVSIGLHPRTFQKILYFKHPLKGYTKKFFPKRLTESEILEMIDLDMSQGDEPGKNHRIYDKNLHMKVNDSQ